MILFKKLNNLIGWITDLVLDTGVNLAKRMLILNKGKLHEVSGNY